MARIATTYMWVEESEDGTGVRVENPVDGGIVSATRYGRRVLFNFAGDNPDEVVVMDIPVQAARELIAALARFDSNVLTGDEEG